MGKLIRVLRFCDSKDEVDFDESVDGETGGTDTRAAGQGSFEQGDVLSVEGVEVGEVGEVDPHHEGVVQARRRHGGGNGG